MGVSQVYVASDVRKRMAHFVANRCHTPALGASFAGTLVSDFYAVYNGLDCAKQRCLVHLLRELAKLREELPWQSVRAFIGPLISLLQDAIQLGKDRTKLGAAAFRQARQGILDRFADLLLTQTRQPHR